jgi:hypothetical protein
MNIVTPEIHLHFQQFEAIQVGIALDFDFG